MREIDFVQSWHEEGLAEAAHFKHNQYRLVYLLSQINRCEGFRRYKSASLQEYAQHCWDLPEYTAADMVTIARKAADIPEMIEALRLKGVTVSKLRKVCSVITPQTQKEWITLVAECPKRTIEKCVAMAKPETARVEQVVYKSENILTMTADIPESLALKHERVKDLLSQKLKRAVSLAEALEFLADLGLERIDPLRKAERAHARRQKFAAQAQSASSEAPAPVEPTTPAEAANPAPVAESALATNTASPKSGPGQNSLRETVAAATRHALQLRDQAQCTDVNELGERCPNRRWLEIHHIEPVSRGGTNELENLTTLCSRHHRAHHFLKGI